LPDDLRLIERKRDAGGVAVVDAAIGRRVDAARALLAGPEAADAKKPRRPAPPMLLVVLASRRSLPCRRGDASRVPYPGTAVPGKGALRGAIGGFSSSSWRGRRNPE